MRRPSTRKTKGPSPDPLLETAVYHLSRRDFQQCRSFAIRSISSAPLLIEAYRVLAVADTLFAAETRIFETLIDWYAVLQIHRYSQDSHLINQHFKKLSILLYDCKYPLSQQAFKLVCEAGSVLTNPEKKSQFDDELKALEFNSDETFWTMCPYCYCMYEYVRVYEDCCLKCQNENCLRGFHAVVVESPPHNVVGEEEYMCFGYFPLGFDESLRKEDENQNLFSPLVRVNDGGAEEKKSDVIGTAYDSGIFFDIFGECDDSDYGVGGDNVGYCGNGNADADDGNVVKIGEVHEGNSFEKPRRKKLLPRNARKRVGKGLGDMRTENVAQSAERLDLNTRVGEDNSGGNDNELRHASGVKMGNDAGFDSGVEIIDGDDDIFVSFPDFF